MTKKYGSQRQQEFDCVISVKRRKDSLTPARRVSEGSGNPLLALRARALSAAICLAVGMILASGCGKTITSKDKSTSNGVVQPVQSPLDAAGSLLRSKTDAAQCAESIQLVNNHLQKDRKSRIQAGKHRTDSKLLRDVFHLTEAEIAYVNQIEFTRLDVFHMEWCFRMREIASALQLSDLPRLEQAKLAFAWAMRQIVLDTSGDRLLPPQYILNRGRGTAPERALVFLALMHQLDVPGCMIAVPGQSNNEPHYWAAGVLIDEKVESSKAGNAKAKIYLFEPRLGVPVPGPGGKGVATLWQLRKKPDLLKQLNTPDLAFDITPKHVSEATVQMVCPLSGMSSRMNFLEETVNRAVSVQFALKPAAVLARFKEVAGNAHVWNPAAGGNGNRNSPIRAARYFLPKEMGGVAPKEQLEEHSRELKPYYSVMRNYQRMQYNELPLLAKQQLFELTDHLLRIYLEQPRDSLTRGRWDEELTKPIVRFQKVLRGFRRSEFHQNANIRDAKISEWVKNAEGAYIAYLEKQPKGKVAVAAIWRDPYFMQLVMPGKEDEDIDNDFPKGMVTYYVLEAADRPITKEADYLLALAWLEKAERSQQRANWLLEQKKDIAISLANEIRNNWMLSVGSDKGPDKVVGYTERYAKRYSMTPAGAAAALQTLLRGANVPMQIGLWQEFLQDIHRAAAMRLHLADGLLHAGRSDSAKAQLQSLQSDLNALLNSKELEKSFFVEFAQPANDLPLSMRQRLRRMFDTLNSDGSLHWYLHAAAYRLDKLR